MRRLISFNLFLCGVFTVTLAQEQHLFTLNQAIRQAQNQSLLAKKAENKYLASYWRYETFLSELKPFLSLSTRPVNFSRAVIERYDSDLNRDVYRSQQTFSSFLNISISQQIGLTGGRIFIDSEFGRLQTLGTDPITNYFTTPIRIGFSQNLGGYNPYKWKKEIEPLAELKARKDYLLDREMVALEVIQLFFQLAEHQLISEIASFTFTQVDSLYLLSMDRFSLGTITQDDLLEIEMDRIRAQREMVSASLATKNAGDQLKSMLRISGEATLSLTLPEELPELNIDKDVALNLSRNHHPDILGFRQKVLEARQTLEQTEKNNKFQASLNASFGVNQQSVTINDAFAFPMDQQQRVLLSLDIPILDWGLRKGQREMARSNLEVIKAEVAQQQLDLEREVSNILQTIELQPGLVEQAKNIERLALRRYEITRKRFLLGGVDLLKLNASLLARNQARREYLEELQTFWIAYYSLRMMTLYDFENQQSLKMD